MGGGMSTLYPTAVDDNTTLPNPASDNATNSPSLSDGQSNQNDAIKAIETKLGTGDDTPAANQFLFGTGAGSSAWQALTSAELRSAVSDETGTGSLVFANTPTLVTPKVDTINENTGGNGVSVDGVLLKDGVIDSSSALLDKVDHDAIQDDAVHSRNIDWAATGGGDDGGIWWEELGRHTLSGAADSLSVASIPVRRYLKIIAYVDDTGGTVGGLLRFNNDSGNNYSGRTSTDGAADAATTSAAQILASPSTAAMAFFTEVLIINIAAKEKLATMFTVSDGATAGAATAPSRREGGGKWVNTSDAISRVDLVNSGTGDYAIGSELIVMGHN